MKLLQPDQLELVTWQQAFESKPQAEQDFLDSVNEHGIPKGLLPLNKSTINNFLATFVLRDWLHYPVAMAAHKSNQVGERGTVAIIGSLCCVKYSGYKLSRYPLVASVAHAIESGADMIEARCNQFSKGLFASIGFEIADHHEDGKSLMQLKVEGNSLFTIPSIVHIELPSFTDGGVYD